MTIKEMETLSGLTRANIRFYESEGLLNPERGSNGYRNYSQEDLEILKRVKLLRSLHMPLTEILSLHRGEEQLLPAMDRRIAALQAEQGEIDRAIGVCREIRSDGGDYRTLDAQHYLDSLAIPQRNITQVLTSDVRPKPFCPWRRLFAREFDWMLLSTLWVLFLMLAFRVNFSDRSAGLEFFNFLVTFVLCLLLEPAMLHFFGTTPGKWILGLSVTDNDGEKLEYGDAVSRYWLVFSKGQGYSIPFYSLWRLWKSYEVCDTQTLEWEYDSEIQLKDRKIWRIFALLFAFAALFGVLYLGVGLSAMPKNRGDINTAQFCDNYNQLAKYYRMQEYEILNTEGQWITPSDSDINGVFYGVSSELRPVFSFVETDGVLTQVRFQCAASSDFWGVDLFHNKMLLTAMAFAEAQKGFGPFSGKTKAMIEYINSVRNASFVYSSGGITLTCEVRFSGYYISEGVLIPQKGRDQSYQMDFMITKDT